MGSSGKLRVSVLVPTRNRVDLLRELIESIWKQTLDPSEYELIVIDNCSTDGTRALLEDMAGRAPCRMRFVVMTENRGPVHTRNLAAKMAESEILAFTDSDCAVHPSWIENGLAAFGESPAVALVSGPVVDKPGQAVRFFTLRNGAGATENFTYPTCNVFYRKSVFLALGGFDESVWLLDIANSPIECADTDLAWKVKEHGHRNVFRPDVIVYHEVALVKPMVWLLYHTRLLVIPELVRRHPQLRKELLLGKLFFSWENVLFYLFILGLAAAAADGVWWLALSVPYLAWAVSLRGRGPVLMRIPRAAARIPFFITRQFVVCGSLLYGSLRSRTLVL